MSKVGGRREEKEAWLPVANPADLRCDLEANLRTLGVDQLAVMNLRLMDSDEPDELFDEQVRDAAGRLGYTPARVALGWALSVAPHILLIPGTSSVAHLEENLAVTDIELDDELRAQLHAVP
jgi:aryl-alcohol dehydrogenase-like predicted oxidoreductase